MVAQIVDRNLSNILTLEIFDTSVSRTQSIKKMLVEEGYAKVVQVAVTIEGSKSTSLFKKNFEGRTNAELQLELSTTKGRIKVTGVK